MRGCATSSSPSLNTHASVMCVSALVTVDVRSSRQPLRFTVRAMRSGWCIVLGISRARSVSVLHTNPRFFARFRQWGGHYTRPVAYLVRAPERFMGGCKFNSGNTKTKYMTVDISGPHVDTCVHAT